MKTSSDFKVITTSGFPAAIFDFLTCHDDCSTLCDVYVSRQLKYVLELAKHTDLNQFYSDIWTFRCNAFNNPVLSTVDTSVLPPLLLNPVSYKHK